MAPIVSFIGRTDHRTTSLAAAVVAHLRARGFRIGVVREAPPGAPIPGHVDADGAAYRRAGAESVVLVTAGQLFLETESRPCSLTALAYRFCADVDLVIGEGFSESSKIGKIEVVHDEDLGLRRTVYGVVAVVADCPVSADYVFRLNEAEELADFLVKKYLYREKRHKQYVSLLVNGRNVPLKDFIQESLAGVVMGYINTLKLTDGATEVELRIAPVTGSREHT